ncbi:MAG: hypothetical protein ACRDK2_16620 [Solirubrobacteraceae bacterium]
MFRTPRPGHPCRNTYNALITAGYRPTVVRCYGWGLLPPWLNRSRGRREIRRLTGASFLDFNHNVSSLLMALLALGALSCYLVGLYLQLDRQ